MKSIILRFAGAGIVSLAVGAAGAHASTVVISNTGPFSYNWASVSNSSSVTRTNYNYLTVNNSNSQSATSGSATTSYNTFGGSARSGSASNWNSTNTWVSVSN